MITYMSSYMCIYMMCKDSSTHWVFFHVVLNYNIMIASSYGHNCTCITLDFLNMAFY